MAIAVFLASAQERRKKASKSGLEDGLYEESKQKWVNDYMSEHFSFISVRELKDETSHDEV